MRRGGAFSKMSDIKKCLNCPIRWVGIAYYYVSDAAPNTKCANGDIKIDIHSDRNYNNAP